jgi:hypothetical protein
MRDERVRVAATSRAGEEPLTRAPPFGMGIFYIDERAQGFVPFLREKTVSKPSRFYLARFALWLRRESLTYPRYALASAPCRRAKSLAIYGASGIGNRIKTFRRLDNREKGCYIMGSRKAPGLGACRARSPPGRRPAARPSGSH